MDFQDLTGISSILIVIALAILMVPAAVAAVRRSNLRAFIIVGCIINVGLTLENFLISVLVWLVLLLAAMVSKHSLPELKKPDKH